MGINDSFLEQNNIMIPVISIHLDYLKPAYYDELLNVKTIIKEMPYTRFRFEFEIKNQYEKKYVPLIQPWFL